MNNSFSINRSAAQIPDVIDLNDVALNERSLTLPNQEEVVAGLERLPVYNPPQSNIGLSSGIGNLANEIQVNLPVSNGVPVAIAQPRRDQPISLPIVLTNNQLPVRNDDSHDDFCEDLKTDCRDYWTCQESDEPCVQGWRCTTFHGVFSMLIVASAGLCCLPYCCWNYAVRGGNHGGGNNPCSPKTFSKSCLPDC